METPFTRYEIRVSGRLSPQWMDWFEGLTITFEDSETRITGSIADQAALYGLLKRLRDIGLPLLSVKQLPPGEAANQPTKE